MSAKEERQVIEDRVKCLKKTKLRATPATLKRLVHHVIAAVTLGEEKTQIAYWVGQDEIEKNGNATSSKGGGIQEFRKGLERKFVHAKNANHFGELTRDGGIQDFNGGFILWNGGARPKSNPPVYLVDSIDTISFCRSRIFRASQKMADKGLSFRDISRQLNVAKATVVQTLKRGGYDKKTSPSCLSKAWSGVVPYGYVVVQGRLVSDPREQDIIRLMKNYRRKGMGYWEITRALNKHGLKSRKGCEWKHQTVRAILLRKC